MLLGNACAYSLHFDLTSFIIFKLWWTVNASVYLDGQKILVSYIISILSALRIYLFIAGLKTARCVKIPHLSDKSSISKYLRKTFSHLNMITYLLDRVYRFLSTRVKTIYLSSLILFTHTIHSIEATKEIRMCYNCTIKSPHFSL